MRRGRVWVRHAGGWSPVELESQTGLESLALWSELDTVEKKQGTQESCSSVSESDDDEDYFEMKE